MKKTFFQVSFIALAGLIFAVIAYRFTQSPVFFSLSVTFGTTFYHFAMRLVVGLLVDAALHNQVDYTKKWFQEKPFERGLYQTLRVHNWKNKLPTFDPKLFSFKDRSMEQIVQATCQAEIVHETIMVFSFVPLLFSIWFGSLDVFLITSFISFLVDGVFVILQRYNRPRLLQMMKRKQQKEGFK